MPSKSVMNKLQERAEYFKMDNMMCFNKSYLNLIYMRGLMDNLVRYVDKYLEISKRKDAEYIRNGSTAACFRIGDYAFKLFSKKYSSNICPDLYLIAKTYEKDYVKDNNGKIIGGIEVQPFLTRSASNIPCEILKKYKDELKKFKYELNDSLIGSRYGDNVMLLDSYKDADCENPEELPDWFKEYPLVLVDRDLVENINVK